MTTTPRPLCFVDTETDGLHPGRRAWDIAIIRREPDGYEREHQMFVRLDLRNADRMALDVGGFFDRHPVGRKVAGLKPTPGPEPLDGHEAARDVMRLTHGATLVGAVPSFDAETLANLLRSHGYMPTWHHRLVCVESMTAGAAGRLVGGLSDCAGVCDLDPSTYAAHTALGDAQLARDIYDHHMADR